MHFPLGWDDSHRWALSLHKNSVTNSGCLYTSAVNFCPVLVNLMVFGVSLESPCSWKCGNLEVFGLKKLQDLVAAEEKSGSVFKVLPVDSQPRGLKAPSLLILNLIIFKSKLEFPENSRDITPAERQQILDSVVGLSLGGAEASPN